MRYFLPVLVFFLFCSRANGSLKFIFSDARHVLVVCAKDWDFGTGLNNLDFGCGLRLSCSLVVHVRTIQFSNLNKVYIFFRYRGDTKQVKSGLHAEK